jgi:hypothetical protein
MLVNRWENTVKRFLVDFFGLVLPNLKQVLLAFVGGLDLRFDDLNKYGAELHLVMINYGVFDLVDG